MSKRINDGLPLAAAVFIIAVVALIVFMIVGNYAYAADSWVDGVQATDDSADVAILLAQSNDYFKVDGSLLMGGNIEMATNNNIYIKHGAGTGVIQWNTKGTESGFEEYQLFASAAATSNGFWFTSHQGTVQPIYASRFSSGTNQAYVSTDPDAVIIADGDLEIVSTNNFTYFGPSTSNGSWRVGIVTNSFVTERRESSTWVRKQTIAP